MVLQGLKFPFFAFCWSNRISVGNFLEMIFPLRALKDLRKIHIQLPLEYWRLRKKRREKTGVRKTSSLSIIEMPATQIRWIPRLYQDFFSGKIQSIIESLSLKMKLVCKSIIFEYVYTLNQNYISGSKNYFILYFLSFILFSLCQKYQKKMSKSY